MLVHKKIMFDCYYCIKTQRDARKHENFEEIKQVNLYFLWLKNHEKGMFTVFILKTLHPGQRPVSF